VLLLISYDLSTPERPGAYESIEAAINDVALESSRPLYSQWLVVTNEGVDEWSARLTPFMTPRDRLLIVRVQSRANGWLPGNFWPWINRHVA
jgi:hypothetical protein